MQNSELLSKALLFRGMAQESIGQVLSGSRRRQYSPGEVIFQQGERGSEMHVIASGSVRISIASEDGREQDIGLLGRGDCFGEMSLLDGGGRSASVTARTQVETLAFDREQFFGILGKNPSILKHIVLLLCRRLRVTDKMLADLLFLNVSDRVARQLAQLAAAQGGLEEGQIVIAASQDDLARMTGATRETVNRALRKYEDSGLLRTSRGEIIIKDMQSLRSLLQAST